MRGSRSGSSRSSASCSSSASSASRWARASVTLDDDLGRVHRLRPDLGVARPSSRRCGCRARCSASPPARRSGSAARSCRASPATRWPTPGSWASTPALRPASSSAIMLFGTPAAGRVHLARVPGRGRSRRSLVYGVASLGREGATPVKLALAGAAVTAGLDVGDDGDRPDQRRRAQRAALLAGRLARRPLHADLLADGAVHRSSGVVVALGSGRALNGLALGEDVARRARPAGPADAASCCS